MLVNTHIQDRLDLKITGLKTQLMALLPEPGKLVTDIHGLTLTRYDVTGYKDTCICNPVIAFIIQGLKRSLYADEEYIYGEGTCTIIAVDMPSKVYITEATSEKPFLSLSLPLDRVIISQLEAELPQPLSLSLTNISQRSIALTEVSQELRAAFERLVGLLYKPHQILVLAPMIIREIYYYLLSSPIGDTLRLFNYNGSPCHEIALAVTWLKENYRGSLDIKELAQRANMSQSSFNRHFRKVTNLSPLQFQKRLRLYEAQRLMLTENLNTENVAISVGYNSSTQFTREYKKLFGEPPRTNVKRLSQHQHI
jgi:AraC-like DNA-binding protein